MKYKRSNYNIIIKKNKKNIYLYNTYSGALCSLTKEKYDILNNIENLENCDDEYKNQLIKQGFIVDANLNEYNRILVSQYKTIFNPNPSILGFVIAPTLKCNLRCVYCFESQSCKIDGFNENTQKDILNFIKKKIENNPNVKMVAIDWFGGEPMIKYQEIIKFSQELIKFCNEKAIIYKSCMLTNGTLLTREKAKNLKEKANLKSVQIPLDGNEIMYCKLKQTNEQTFKQVIKNITEINDILKVQVRLNTNKQNYDSIKELTKYLLKDLNLYGKIRIYIAELKYFEGYTEFNKNECLEDANFLKTKLDFLNYVKKELKFEDFKFSYEMPKNITCGICKCENCVIGPEGELYRCEHHVGHKENIIGYCDKGENYSDVDIDYMIPKMNAKCKKCKMYPTCMCGCKSSFLMKGNNKEFCESMKKGLIELLKLKITDIEKNIDSTYGKRR